MDEPVRKYFELGPQVWRNSRRKKIVEELYKLVRELEKLKKESLD
jgi:hypothetical protein